MLLRREAIQAVKTVGFGIRWPRAQVPAPFFVRPWEIVLGSSISSFVQWVQ